MVKRSADHRYAKMASPGIPEGCQTRRGAEDSHRTWRRARAGGCSSGTPPACGNRWGPPCPVVSLLDHRLISGNPPGSLRGDVKRSTTRHQL